MTNVFKCFYVFLKRLLGVIVLAEFSLRVARGGWSNAPPKIWFLLKQLNF